MPKITVEGRGTFDVPQEQRLVIAIESNGVDILHRCGGYARCTTCRVQFVEGEPATMTQAEKDKLAERNLLGEARLSCQIVCGHDMTVRVLQTLSESGLPDPGGAPEPHITPAPEWTTK
jgi:ferredoxin